MFFRSIVIFIFLTAKVAKVYAKTAMFFLFAKSRSRKAFSSIVIFVFLTAKVAKVYAKNAMFFCSQSRWLSGAEPQSFFRNIVLLSEVEGPQSSSAKIGLNLNLKNLRLSDLARDYRATSNFFPFCN
jgi:hypothetical protein